MAQALTTGVQDVDSLSHLIRDFMLDPGKIMPLLAELGVDKIQVRPAFSELRIQRISVVTFPPLLTRESAQVKILAKLLECHDRMWRCSRTAMLMALD